MSSSAVTHPTTTRRGVKRERQETDIAGDIDTKCARQDIEGDEIDIVALEREIDLALAREDNALVADALARALDIEESVAFEFEMSDDREGLLRSLEDDRERDFMIRAWARWFKANP